MCKSIEMAVDAAGVLLQLPLTDTTQSESLGRVNVAKFIPGT